MKWQSSLVAPSKLTSSPPLFHDYTVKQFGLNVRCGGVGGWMGVGSWVRQEGGFGALATVLIGPLTWISQNLVAWWHTAHSAWEESMAWILCSLSDSPLWILLTTSCIPWYVICHWSQNLFDLLLKIDRWQSLCNCKIHCSSCKFIYTSQNNDNCILVMWHIKGTDSRAIRFQVHMAWYNHPNEYIAIPWHMACDNFPKRPGAQSYQWRLER